ncbi:pyridoxamine 5'-phosphate oxidase family protein [Actinospica sp. MGRD01-02]|uniref:Pyridoxamine 5'-phosphate oxidase family protein n=1 Tax=Actinospica acidithermotolerans TaxID=2828514 RepID=A0A941EJG5_9ACTN|nr:pyridoxamine 5'-phosphate oxidase family protein [Actinospica acidithermotolerans]MBR7831513.1 pyridoxamine 5'-phosphate oxidase family protein [Actinospica acidithermotolerans]
MNTTDAKPLSEISQAEALTLLATQEIGRLVYTRRALPAVTPVNFVLRDGAIWIWTASASSMWQAVRGAVVAFEADAIDPVERTGWSVVVLGVAEWVREPAAVERALADGPEPWVMGRKEHLLRIPLTSVSGRRIVPLATDLAHTSP